jgi:hypothetical protein
MKHESPMLVTELGIEIFVKPLQLPKHEFCITINELGSVTLAKLVQP